MAVNSITTAINKLKMSATIQIILGALLCPFNAMMVITGISMTVKDSITAPEELPIDIGMLVFFSILSIIGAFMLVMGIKKSKLTKKFNDYSARLAADPEKSIDRLAASMGASPEAVTKNLIKMINSGFFPGCYIDKQRNCMVIPGRPDIHSGAQGAPKPTAVRCPGCGAPNQVFANAAGKCEYCGSPLQGAKN